MLTQPIVTQALELLPFNVGKKKKKKKEMRNAAPTWQLISDVMLKLTKARITTARQDKREKE
jgi:hypothetical protein